MRLGCVVRGSAAAVAATAFFAAAAAALGLPPFTTAPKSAAAGGAGQAELVALTTGCHPSFDRVVVRARFATPGYGVRYVSRIVQPSGAPLRIRGAALLELAIRPARGHTAGGAPLLPAVSVPNCPVLREVKRAEDFEGVVVLGLGVSRKAPFRVFRLAGPSRIVVDLRH
jgi:hypothetical protein